MATTTPPTATPKTSRKRWYLIAGFFLLFLATPVGYYVIAGWVRDRQLAEIYRELDEEDPHWRWPDLVKQLQPPPDDENVVVQMLKVDALLKKTPFNIGPKWENANPPPLSFRNARLSEENAQLLKTAFDKLDPQVVKEARMLRGMPNGRIPLADTDNPFAQTIKIQEMRSVLYLLQHDVAMQAHVEDDLEKAAESCRALLNATHAFNDHPTLISQLVRMAAQAISVAALERTLGQGVLSEQTLRELQEMVEREASDNAFYHGMRGELAAGDQMVRSLKSGKVKWSGLLGNAKAPANTVDQLVDLFPGILLHGYPEHLRHMRDAVRATKLPDTEQMEVFQKHEQKIRQSRSTLTRMIMPATLKVAIASQRSQAHLRSTAVAIAAERYRLQQQRWPASIDEIVKAGLLKETPKDPYDGKPLRLTRTPTGVIVYSIGPNKVDNGGKLNRDNPMAADIDYGFELWEPSLRGTPAPPAVEDRVGGK